MHYLEGLNDRQKEAVLATEGPLLIVAGAGAGKTKTLTHRILHLIKLGVDPENILAITFTNKSGKEMRERVSHLLAKDADLNRGASFGNDFPGRKGRPFVSTFHSLGVHIIKENAAKLGLPSRFSIFDRADSKKAVRDALKDAGYDPTQFEPNKLLGIISREKGAMVSLADFAPRATKDFYSKMVYEVWRRYEAALAREKALDFDDLLLKTALMLRDDEEVRSRYQDQWKYVHIDEYQDTNRVQYTIAKALAERNRNICVVGDADQTIYTWRGATIDNILSFERDYPEAVTVLLEQNYRSSKTIIAAANAVIIKNKKRQAKNLFTESDDGEKITVRGGFDERDEARYLAEMASGLIEKGVSANNMAVLYRANFQSRAIEEAMLRAGVPYQVLGTRFFDRKEIKDVLAYVKLALNPDSLSDFTRAVNEPARGIGKVTLLKMIEGRDAELTGKSRESAATFRSIMAHLQTMVTTQKASDVIKTVLERAGFERVLKDEGEDGAERLENIKELVSLAIGYDHLPPSEGIEQMLTDASLATDQDDLNKDNGGMKLMTVHASKGLEFDVVFVTGMEEGIFPHSDMGGKDANRDDEEERRLFYVAITRAKAKLFLTYAHMRTIFGAKDVHAPSHFLDDIDPELIEVSDVYGQDAESQRKSAIRDIFIDF